ncbi:MAG: hypothetical protein EZS28_017137 [Streblomastix strix]|uniref:Protein kinase domain-containing protein n=1 Tax=Streblomastix strix TaxID=222440 RepID=A0A5J4VXI2_9EUKA|nr:MAG: hypothetical protein EZS28_017137 [Streblomastix strix]
MARTAQSTILRQTRIGGTLSQIQTKMADMFALGVMFYEVIALKHPFAGKSGIVSKKKILQCQPDPLPNNISEPLKQIVMALLNKVCIQSLK